MGQQPVERPLDRAELPAGEDQTLLELAVSGEASDELSSDPTFQVIQVVARWAKAWQEQRPDGYLAEYEPDFVPSSGGTHEQWAGRRAERIRAPQSIRVTVLDLEVVLDSDQSATASFRQIYESDRFGDVVRKTLRFGRDGDSWKIVAEASSPVTGAP